MVEWAVAFSSSREGHGRPQGGAKWALAPLEIGTENQKFLGNEKSAA